MAKPSTKLTRAEPPPARIQRYNWDVIAAQLKESPGEWFKVFDHDSTNYATAIRNNDIKALRNTEGFQYRTSNNTRGRPSSHPDGFERRTCTLFLRYVPRKKGA